MRSLVVALVLVAQRPAAAAPPHRCATPVELARLRDGRAWQVRARPVLSGTEQTVGSEDGRFLFHFTREGVDAVRDVDESPRNGLPDYVDDVMEGVRRADEAWVRDGGWPAPPPDRGQGGDERIDIYIKQITCEEASGISSCGSDGRIPSFLFGITRAEDRLPGPSRNAWTSYVVVNPSNDIPLGRNFARSVAAHEYHHVIQFGMDAGEPGWVYEATSAYLQLALFRILEETPYLVDALLVPRLDRPDLGLENLEGRFEYANGLWFRFLVDRFGEEDIVREVWTRAAAATTTGFYAAFDDALAPYGSSFAAAFLEWGEWNYFLCGRDDGRHYDKGDYCVSPHVSVRLDAAHRSYPVADAALSRPPEPLGFAYVELEPDGRGRDLVVDLSGAGGLAARLIRVGTDCASSVVEVPIGSDGRASARVPDVHRYRRVTLLVAHPIRGGSLPMSLRYGARTEGAYGGPPPTATVRQSALEVEPAAVAFQTPGETANLIAIARFDDCTSLNATLRPDIVWRSVDPGVAEVNASGVVTARGIGKTFVIASFGGLDSVPVPVQVGPALSPTSPPGGCGCGAPGAGGSPVLALALALAALAAYAARREK